LPGKGCASRASSALGSKGRFGLGSELSRETADTWHGSSGDDGNLGRTDVACDVRAGANCLNKKRPSEYFKDQLLVDSMVFSPEDIRHLVAKSGPTQVVYGTDIPIYNWPDAIDNILKAEIPDAQKEMILGGNLAKLLKL